MARLPRLALPDLPYHHLELVTGRRLRRGRPGQPKIQKSVCVTGIIKAPR